MAGDGRLDDSLCHICKARPCSYDNCFLSVEDDENSDDDAQEVDKDAKEAKEEHIAEEVADEEDDDDEEEDEDDEQLEDGKNGLESETNAVVEGDQDALSIPMFVRAIEASK
nr:nucleolin-like [Nicotiana tomentosiformis]